MATALRPASVPRSIPFFSLSRITSSGNFIPEIDGLRFVAIAAVVAFHIYEYLISRSGMSPFGIAGTALLHGQRGVPLFFVISGFILGRPFAAHYICGAPAPKLKEYYWRRVTRLEPPYLLAIIAVFMGLAAFSSDRGLPHLLASLIYSHNLIYGSPNPFFGLAWSLEVEIQFYLLIPLLAMVYTLPRRWRRLILAAFMFAGLLHLVPLPARFTLSILGWIQCFAAGLLLADLYTDGWNKSQNWIFDLCSISLWPAVFLIGDKAAWIALPFFALILYVAAFRAFMFRRFFTFTLVSTIGGMCYTIYLVHYPMISVAGRMAKNPLAITAVSLLAIAVASLIFFVCIERPCMDKRWPSRILAIFQSS
jgi:peptidoglycan/LPS O-acetylase OafA/YrhL